MKGRKNDFSMSFYNDQERTMFLEFVHDTEKAILWTQNKGVIFTHYVIYDRRTRAQIKRVVIG